MTVTIWHNPKCSTSRRVLDMIRERGIEPQVVEYLKTPPTKAQLNEMLARLGAGPADILRRKGNDALLADGPQGAALLDRMVANPILIERPIVQTPKGAALCRPVERVLDLL
jgi:arsenate reductase